MKYSELIATIDKAVDKALTGRGKSVISRLEKFRESTLAADKRRNAEAEIAALVKTGQIPPVERAHELELLLSLDANTVHKFSEKGKTVSQTMYDRHLAKLRARPSLFGERFKDQAAGKAAVSAAADDEEVAKVEAHYEKFSEDFPRGTTKENFVAGFKAAKKYQKDLTAEQFLGRAS